MAGTHHTRMTPYHDAELSFDGATCLQRMIIQFVKGIRRDRENPVTEKQIVRWFRATDPEFVREQLTAVVADGRVVIHQKSLSSGRRFNGSYVYAAAHPRRPQPGKE